jgi:hypothetical protein
MSCFFLQVSWIHQFSTKFSPSDFAPATPEKKQPTTKAPATPPSYAASDDDSVVSVSPSLWTSKPRSSSAVSDSSSYESPAHDTQTTDMLTDLLDTPPAAALPVTLPPLSLFRPPSSGRQFDQHEIALLKAAKAARVASNAGSKPADSKPADSKPAEAKRSRLLGRSDLAIERGDVTIDGGRLETGACVALESEDHELWTAAVVKVHTDKQHLDVQWIEPENASASPPIGKYIPLERCETNGKQYTWTNKISMTALVYVFSNMRLDSGTAKISGKMLSSEYKNAEGCLAQRHKEESAKKKKAKAAKAKTEKKKTAKKKTAKKKPAKKEVDHMAILEATLKQLAEANKKLEKMSAKCMKKPSSKKRPCPTQDKKSSKRQAKLSASPEI